MLDVTLFGIPIIVVVAIIVVAVALIVFLIYTLRVKHRVAQYSEDFANAVDKFNSLCNPGRPMSGDEWEHFASAHAADFEHAAEVAGSKFIAWAVKDLTNANLLANIQENHEAYQSKAQTTTTLSSSTNPITLHFDSDLHNTVAE